MTRVLTLPFEINDLTQFVSVSNVGGSIALDTSIKRSGARSLKVASLSSGVHKYAVYEYVSSGDAVRRFFRIYLYVVTRPSAANTIITVGNGSNITSADVASIKLAADGSLELWNMTGTPAKIGSSSSVLSLNTWYRVSVQVNPNPADGSREIRGQLDGSEFAAATNITGQALQTRILGLGGNMSGESQSTGEWYFDDGAINDDSGSADTSYPGACAETGILFPTGAGANNAWTRGGTDSGANWSQVDENPPNDGTDYVGSSTLDQLDDYAITDSPAAALVDSTWGPFCVHGQFGGASATDASNSEFKARLTIGGSTSEGANNRPSGTAYFPNRVGQPLPLLVVGGSGITKAHVDAAQAGVHLSIANASAVRVSTLWVIYEVTAYGTGVVASSPSGGLLTLGVG